jgi:multisubunit Na+/H+ antiporter MnhB subunit
MAKRRSTAPIRFVVSLFLGAATVGFIAFSATKLSGNTLISEVTTYAQTPGLSLARLITPTPAPWGGLVVGCGIAVYTVLWFIILSMIWHTRSASVRPHS